MRMVVLDGSAANPGDISWDALRKFGDLTVYDVTLPEQVAERTCGAQIAFTNKTPFTSEILDRLPDLRYIGVLATGYNVIDTEACKRKGITVTNVPEYGTYATMQHTFALLLELTNHVSLHNRAVHEGEWITSEQFCFWKAPLTELCGKNIVIIGYGKIGRRVAAAAAAFGMNVIAVPHRSNTASENGIRFMSLSDALPVADIITLHAPLTSETKGLINRKTLGMCKKGVLLINTGRGPLINENDVCEALSDGHLGGYAADVISSEPMLADNPLRNAPNCILTPHIAWAPRETRERLIEAAAQNLEHFLAGDIINSVIPE